jgi:hypothetical protein
VLNSVLDQLSSVPARKLSGPEGPNARSESAPTEAPGLKMRAQAACNAVCDLSAEGRFLKDGVAFHEGNIAPHFFPGPFVRLGAGDAGRINDKTALFALADMAAEL